MTLSNEELARVARVVSGKPFVWHQPGPGYPYVRSQIENRLDEVWMPAFHDNELQRSQALAIVEWLANKIETDGPINLRQKWRMIRLYIHNKDTTALMRMVIELGEL